MRSPSAAQRVSPASSGQGRAPGQAAVVWGRAPGPVGDEGGGCQTGAEQARVIGQTWPAARV